jgi:uncharacterized damage-inducible protein DinB
MARTADSLVTQLLQLLDEAFDRRAWHGTNLRGSIRGLPAVLAAWRPPTRARRSIADIVVHAAYWKYTVRRRLTGEKRGSFPLAGSDWFDLPDPLTEADWRDCVHLLVDQHAALRAAVSALRPARLPATPACSKTTYRMLIQGVAQHDVYHAGQIQLVKALHKAAARG